MPTASAARIAAYNGTGANTKRLVMDGFARSAGCLGYLPDFFWGDMFDADFFKGDRQANQFAEIQYFLQFTE